MAAIFSGKDFRMIDAVYGPIFRSFDVFEQAVDLGMFSGMERIQAWRDQLRARESVQQAVIGNCPERLLAFVRERGNYLSTLLTKAVPDSA